MVGQSMQGGDGVAPHHLLAGPGDKRQSAQMALIMAANAKLEKEKAVAAAIDGELDSWVREKKWQGFKIVGKVDCGKNTVRLTLEDTLGGAMAKHLGRTGQHFDIMGEVNNNKSKHRSCSLPCLMTIFSIFRSRAPKKKGPTHPLCFLDLLLRVLPLPVFSRS